MVRISSLVCMTVLMGSACSAPPVEKGGFESPDPASKMYAIERAARTRDSTAIPQLIEQLDSDDPVVRLLAISALRRLTGQTFEYHYEDPPYLREPAVQRWVTAVDSGELNAGVMAGGPDEPDG